MPEEDERMREKYLASQQEVLRLIMIYYGFKRLKVWIKLKTLI